MEALMIVNRIEDWFDLTDVQLDEHYVAMKILEKLSTRKIKGLDYDRFKLSAALSDRCSFESIKIIDNAIVLLISRNLIRFDQKREERRRILITELGESTYLLYKSEIKK